MSFPLLISVAVALAVILILVGALAGKGKGKEREELRSRLLDTHPSDPISDAQIQASIRRDMRARNGGALNTFLRRFSIFGTLEGWLVQARSNARPGDVLIKSVVLAAVAFFGTYAVTRSASSGIVAGALLGMLPVLNVVRRKTKRMAEFGKQIPDAMTMIKNALRAGHTLGKALAIVADEMPDPLGIEFSDTVEELRLGQSMSTAMNNLAGRMPNDNLKIFVAAVLIQHEVGGNLTELLENIAATIRERYRLDAEVKSLTAEGRISGVVVAVLPIALVAIISLMQPDYMTPLFKTETGNKLLIAATVAETLGFLWIRKVCKVKF